MATGGDLSLAASIDLPLAAALDLPLAAALDLSHALSPNHDLAIRVPEHGRPDWLRGGLSD